jgi:peroxiredoxin
MAIAVGDKVPSVDVKTMTAEGPQSVNTSDVLGQGKVVLFAVPGAFTPGCSKIHLPGYVQHGDELLAKGVDKIVCIAVNDAWVMDEWAKSQGVGDKITMLADGNAEFTKAMGLEFDGGGIGLGLRSRRYAAVIDNGVITALDVEQKPGVDVSSCESVLAKV